MIFLIVEMLSLIHVDASEYYDVSQLIFFLFIEIIVILLNIFQQLTVYCFNI